jgi:hypothetical protein
LIILPVCQLKPTDYRRIVIRQRKDEEIGIFSVIAMPNLNGGFEIVDILSDQVIADLSDQCGEFVRDYGLDCLDDRADYDRDTMLDKQQLRKSASIEGKPPGVNY